MRVRLTVTPRIESPGPGSVDREAGENPARTRHCHRGSPPHARSEPLVRHRTGKARRGRPGSQETSLRPQARSSSGRGGSLQLQFRSAGLTAGLLTLALEPPALAGPTVAVRVEGKGATFAEEQRIATPDGTVSSGDVNSCAGNTPLGAMHQAVGGDWSGAWFGTGTGYFVERIRSENYPSDG